MVSIIHIFSLFILLLLLQLIFTEAVTNPEDFSAISGLKYGWNNVPPSWVGSDPCGGNWEGIGCLRGSVVSITLVSMGLTGQLSGDIQILSNLQTLDLSYNEGLTGSIPQGIGNLKKLSSLILIGCGFSGVIPVSIGSLPQLVTLSLNSNKFIGSIPSSFGSLSNLNWLDLADNRLTGSIPISNATSPGLDMLSNTKHFHFGNNQLSGIIPPQLFSSNMSLIHILFENNQLRGNIPATIGLVQTLEVVRLDGNQLIGLVPSNISQLSNVQDLFLSNNALTGPFPNLTGLNSINYLDLSNNTFDGSNVPTWVTTLASLTTLVMENTRLRGQVPNTLFNLPQLQSVILKNNLLNGTFTIGSTYSNELQLIDLQNNSIAFFTQKAGGYSLQIILADNPICGGGSTETYCLINSKTANSSYSTPINCLASRCPSDYVSSPNCNCSHPYTGKLFFRAPTFSGLGNTTIYTALQQGLLSSFKSHQLPVDSVSLSNPAKNSDNYLVFDLQIFPSGQDYFNRTAVTTIGSLFSSQTFKPPPGFGPYFYISNDYLYFSGALVVSSKSSNTGIIIGAAIGGTVLVLLLILAGLYAFRLKRKADVTDRQMHPFASWDTTKNSGAVPELKGARSFTFEEVRKCTNNFSENNKIGSGGYGQVYRGTLTNGKLVAVKRAQIGSMQGGLEFKTEIELLSRVHHKNVVNIVGFCFDQSEKMLVYEFIANGTLMDALIGKSGIKLDWMRRLRIAVGAARGIQYLHDLADPPIIHRDIKSNNILLDEKLNAKVADFGLSKLLGDLDRTHVTTQVKGTMGYMDPEYYMTQQLTEKSDVYSFGVLLLELITARAPIENGKYIVKEIKELMDNTKDFYNLYTILDPLIRSSALSKSIERFVDLALSCVEGLGAQRPSMSEVVKEIEGIMVLSGLNPNADSASTSDNYGGGGKGTDQYPYSDDSRLFVYSGDYPDAKLEPK